LPYFWKDSKGGKTCEWLSLIELGNRKIEIHPTSVWGLNFCIRKKTFIMLGGFHPDSMPAHLQKYQGDGETGLTLKAVVKKLKCIYCPSIQVFHIISKERLNLEYFKRRAFFQGVCNSFTELRRQHFKKNISSAIEKLRKILSPIKKQFKKAGTSHLPSEIKYIIHELEQEQERGFQFHQHAFKSDEKVKQWVLKKDYWDYKLPV
jgi:hypothetical protein